jgi:3-hydroxyacyl-CoA dehydrogenase
MQVSNLVSLKRDGDVALIVIDNPPVNALSSAVRTGIRDAFRQARDDASVKAIVLIGAGRTFVAGADITEFGKPPQPPVLIDVIAEIDQSPKPTIAAMHGTPLGGGFEVTLACHFRVAAPSTRVGLPEIKLGLFPAAGGTQRLPRLVGHGRALLLNLTGDPITGTQAYEWGLVEQAVPRAELHEAAMRIARTLSQRSPHAMAVIKELASATRDLPLAEGLRQEAQGFMRCIGSEDGAEGVMAFLEKRTPQFTGR